MRFLSRMQELVSVILFAPTSRTTGLTTYAPHVCKHFGSNSLFSQELEMKESEQDYLEFDVMSKLEVD